MAIGKYAAGHTSGLTPRNWSDINAIISDTSALDTLSSSSSGMNSLNSSSTAMYAFISSSTAMDTVHSSSVAMESFWSPTLGSGDSQDYNFSENNGGYIYLSQSHHDGWSTPSTYVDIMTNVDVSDASSLVIDWESTYSKRSSDSYRAGARVSVGGNQLVNHKGHSRQTETLDVSGISGKVNIRLETQADGQGLVSDDGSDVDATIYNLYLQ